MRHRSPRLLLLFVLLAAIAGTSAYLVANRTGRCNLPARVIKQWERAGVCELFWADGLAVLAHQGYVIVRLDRNGHVRDILNTKWEVVPASIQCSEAVVIGQFLTKTYRHSEKDSWRGFPGLIDLESGEHVKVASGDNVSFSLNARADSAQFWSPGYRAFLGTVPHQAGARHDSSIRSRKLALVDRSSPHLVEWISPNGGYPLSWRWSNAGGRPGFRILTGNPGALYRLTSSRQEFLRIPALDDARIAVLSPKLDRAIAFGKSSATEYWVDFSTPEIQKPLLLSGHADVRKMSLGWAAWSPNGVAVALLLLDRGRGQAYQLWVGDPAGELSGLRCEGFRFSSKDWIRGPETTGLPGPGSIVWDADSKQLYCRMIDEQRSDADRVRYVIMRVGIAQKR